MEESSENETEEINGFIIVGRFGEYEALSFH